MSGTLFEPTGGACFSDDKKFRFALWRTWNDNPMVMFIGLNPSKANETKNDHTIDRVSSIAKNNGYGGVYMMNCFPYISTDPDGLDIDFESTRLNDWWLYEAASKCKEIVFAWGNFKVIKDHNRDITIRRMFPNAKALFINKNGSPKHPLYCKKDIQFIPYNP